MNFRPCGLLRTLLVGGTLLILSGGLEVHRDRGIDLVLAGAGAQSIGSDAFVPDAKVAMTEVVAAADLGVGASIENDWAWPAFRVNASRGGYVARPIYAASLEQVWQWQSPLPPEPAWDGPARWDAYNLVMDLPAMRNYDACFHPVSDGQRVYFGSSSTDTLYAANLSDGSIDWTYIASAPIRLAPTFDQGRVYFGCDDGFAYCLDAADGSLQWRFNPADSLNLESRHMIHNNRLISYFPIRTGVTIRDGIAYFGASLLPWRPSLICAVDATTGTFGEAAGTFVTAHEQATLEGPLLIAEDKLIVPQGRIAPVLFDRTSGAKKGTLPGGGGVTIVLTEAGDIVRTEGGGPARAGQVGVFRGKERVASFPRGRAMVVREEAFYVIDGEKLFAAAAQSNELLWQKEVDQPVEIIMAGDTLFVGGRNHVTAINPNDGSIVWTHPVEGSAYGLAIAGDYLIVATDVGTVTAFFAKPLPENPTDLATVDAQPSADAVMPIRPLPAIAPVRDRNVLHRWVFHRSAMQDADGQIPSGDQVKNVTVSDQAGVANIQLGGRGRSIPVGDSGQIEALEFDDSFFAIDQTFADSFPDGPLTIEAWARVDKVAAWGGLVGCLQDDGSTEHGWLLGYRNDKFTLGIAAETSGMTYLSADQAFELKNWYHVVGTYNGQEMRLYVNGQLMATSTEENGKISYPEKRYFSVGAYHDRDERFPLDGALQEVRLYARALNAPQIQRLYEASAPLFPPVTSAVATQSQASFLSWGPLLRYTEPGKAEITYGTRQPLATVVDLIQPQGVVPYTVDVKTTEHRIEIGDLPLRDELQYQIRQSTAEDAEKSVAYAIDTHFNWSLPPGQPTAWVPSLLEQAANPAGVAIVVGEALEAEARQLARETQYHVILQVAGEDAAVRLRKAWQADPQIVYGTRSFITHLPLGQLPAAVGTMVLASQDTPAIRRLVRPAGGILSDTQKVLFKRGGLPGAGDWSHMYGLADNSAFGGETLGDASNKQDLVTQWIGRPGPRYQTDRQNRKPAPLAVDGRMFLQGQQRLIALDSFSGTVLWSLETPTVLRWNVPHDCSNWCADSQFVYVAADDQVWKIDAKTGQRVGHYPVPQLAAQPELPNWGYVARYENQLLGTSVERSAVKTDWWGPSKWFDSTDGDDTHVVAGNGLFSMDAESGKLNWKHEGLILHPTITVMDEHVFFVQDQTPAHVESKNRLISLDPAQNHAVVCLHLKSGKEIWRQSVQSFPGHLSCLYLAGGGDAKMRSLVLVGSVTGKHKEFIVAALEPKQGNSLWSRTVAWEANHHGKHISRPAIQGDLLYLRPEVMNLETGATLVRGFPSGHGCSSYTLTKNGLFSRLGETTWWNVRKDETYRFDRIRTDCWISTVPAQGMLLVAEGGGGCSCGSWLETSLGFLPRSFDQEASNPQE